MVKIIVPLSLPEREALFFLAQRERREPRDEIAVLVHEALKRRGLLPAEQEPADCRQSDLEKDGNHT